MGLEERKYTKKEMLSFAEHLMAKLLSTNSAEDVTEISSEDLKRIEKILNKYRDE